MDTTTLICLLCGTAAMALVMLLCRQEVDVSLGKGILSTVCLTVIGVAGVKLMFFIENGNFAGLSFFGAVFFIPLFSLPVSWLLKIRYSNYLDLAAPSVAVMLGVMKVNCLIAGCCRGRILANAGTENEIRFPSQIAEMTVAFLIGLILVVFLKKGRLRTLLYPSFALMYGMTRFVLNLFRETDDFWFGMGIGNLWAVVAVLASMLWIFVREKRKKQKG